MALTANTRGDRTIFDRFLERLGGWWRQRRDRCAVITALDHCGRREVARIPREVGVEGGDLRVLAGKWPDGASLLARRIAGLGLDPADMGRTEPQIMRDLQRGCSTCDNERACGHDLDHNPDSPAWQEYCPNVDTFGVAADKAKVPANR